MTDFNRQLNDGMNSHSKSHQQSVAEMMKLASMDKLLTMDREEEGRNDERHQWFHGSVTREGAETVLKEGKVKSESKEKDGLFLIRGGTVSHKKYALSLMKLNTCYHYIIEEKVEGYFQIDDGPLILGLEKIVEHYSNADHGLPCKLTFFCKGTSPPARARKTGYTNLLHTAVQERDVLSVKKILDHKNCPPVDNKNEKGSTALHIAAEEGSGPITRLLLDQDADVKIRDTHGHTPLHRAAVNDHPNIIHILTVYGKADPFEESVPTKWTPLHEAAMKGHINSVKMLLDLKPCPYPRNVDLETPLDLALKYGRNECAKYLSTYNPPDVVKKIKVSYHAELDRDGAQKLLEQYGFRDGLFLIRKSTKGEDYRVLSSCQHGNFSNYVIKSKDYRDRKVYFIDSGPYFLSLSHLIYFYSRSSSALGHSLVVALTTGGELDEIPRQEEYYNLTLETQSSINRDQKQRPELPPRVDFPDHTRPTSPNVKVTPPLLQSDRPPPLQSDRPPPSKAELAKKDSSKPEAPKHAPPTKQKSIEIEQNIIKEKNLKIGAVIGEGEYGSVCKGVLTEYKKIRPKKIDVAIKTFHADCVGNEEDFLREAKVMAGLDNPNIIKLLGVCHGKQLMLVEEFVAMGSMLDYLLEHPTEINIKKDLYLWAGQIAKGMEYLESKKLVHRDLAARNILLASKDQIKISDFGLSRITADYSDCYQASKGGRWPIKWYAPESVNYGKFTHASDVWSYGITLWEMFSFGESPYGEKKGIEVLEFIESGRRLEKPEKCTSSDYKIMRSCWSKDPLERPTFNKLCTDFEKDPNYATVVFSKKTFNGYRVLPTH